MNSELDFGSTATIKNEFHFLMTTYETQFDEEYDYFYRITDDRYIQLASSYYNYELKIIVQYKLQFDTKKEDIIYIVQQLIEANHFIQVVTTNNQWGCGYCKRKGGKEELEKWLQERKSIKDQKRITTMLKELDKGNIQTKKTLKWWLKRY
jgi:hypothetical protein